MQLAHNRSKAEAGSRKDTASSGHFPWWEHVTSDHIHHHIHTKSKWWDKKKAKIHIEGLSNVVDLDHLTDDLQSYNSIKSRLIIMK